MKCPNPKCGKEMYKITSRLMQCSNCGTQRPVEETNQKYLTVDQAAELLSVHPQTIRSWLREKRIKFLKIGRGYRIPGDQFDKLS